MDEIVFEPSDVNMLAALGIVESVKLFPFMLSMGELQYACDSEYRCKQFVNCLSEYYPDSQIEARQLWSKYHVSLIMVSYALAFAFMMLNGLLAFCIGGWRKKAIDFGDSGTA